MMRVSAGTPSCDRRSAKHQRYLPPAGGVCRCGMIPIAPPELYECRTQGASSEASAEDSRRTECVSRNRRDERLARLFQKRERLLAAHARIVFEEVLDRVAAFQEIDQSVNGNAGSDEDGSAAEDLGIGVDDLFRVHKSKQDNATPARPSPEWQACRRRTRRRTGGARRVCRACPASSARSAWRGRGRGR